MSGLERDHKLSNVLGKVYATNKSSGFDLLLTEKYPDPVAKMVAQISKSKEPDAMAKLAAAIKNEKVLSAKLKNKLNAYYRMRKVDRHRDGRVSVEERKAILMQSLGGRHHLFAKAKGVQFGADGRPVKVKRGQAHIIFGHKSAVKGAPKDAAPSVD